MTTAVDRSLNRVDVAAQEAGHWLIALQEEPDDAVLADRFTAWRAADAQNAAAWTEICHVYGLIGQTEPAFEPQWNVSPDPVLPKAPLPGARGHRFRHFIAGTTVLVLATAAWLLAPAMLTRLTADYSTATAEIEAVDLTDGSKVWLGPDSAIDVAWYADRREMRLRAGTAFFEVAPDAARPFSVNIDGVKTTVLGTAFDIRRDAYGVEIAVQHGKVRVASGPKVLADHLTAGQWLRIDNMGSSQQGARAATQIGAWRQYQLIARNQSIAEIIDQIRPYFSGIIIVDDESLAERRLTGIYNLADPVSALEAVAQGHDAVLKHFTPWVLVLSAN
jgi:transmembrane sensor